LTWDQLYPFSSRSLAELGDGLRSSSERIGLEEAEPSRLDVRVAPFFFFFFRFFFTFFPVRQARRLRGEKYVGGGWVGVGWWCGSWN